ncbi:MAG: flagellar hook-basal body complex protein FliE [Planctomycetota bacterium]|nr:flagellar hook-basal body complex protein FliE [Planctomycetota bacterium]
MTGFDVTNISDLLQQARIEALKTQGPQTGETRPLETTTKDGGAEGAAFSDALASAINKVDGLSKDVGNKVEAMAAGEPVALHDIMMSMGKSEVAFNLMLEVRNKLVEAWERLSRSVV